MADQNTDRSKLFSGCFAGMPEMMRKMMSKKDGSCCSCAETMTGMMQECCSDQTEKQSPAEKQAQDAPK